MRNAIWAAVPAVIMSGLVGIGRADAAQSIDTLVCGGHELIIRTNNSNSSDKGGWASVQIVEGGAGHLTPIAFAGVVTDTTINQQLGTFYSAKGAGHAAPNAGSMTCSLQIVTTVAQFVENPDTLPPGAALTDAATLDLTTTVVAH